jgi:hypothetical protein
MNFAICCGLGAHATATRIPKVPSLHLVVDRYATNEPAVTGRLALRTSLTTSPAKLVCSQYDKWRGNE